LGCYRVGLGCLLRKKKQSQVKKGGDPVTAQRESKHFFPLAKKEIAIPLGLNRGSKNREGVSTVFGWFLPGELRVQAYMVRGIEKRAEKKSGKKERHRLGTKASRPKESQEPLGGGKREDVPFKNRALGEETAPDSEDDRLYLCNQIERLHNALIETLFAEEAGGGGGVRERWAIRSLTGQRRGAVFCHPIEYRARCELHPPGRRKKKKCPQGKKKKKTRYCPREAEGIKKKTWRGF